MKHLLLLGIWLVHSDAQQQGCSPGQTLTQGFTTACGSCGNDNSCWIQCINTKNTQGGTLPCVSCERGKYQELSQSYLPCFNCPTDTFQANTGATECLACPWRHMTSYIGGATTCLDCKSRFNRVSYDTVVCEDCAPGSSIQFDGGQCQSCLAGTYGPALSGDRYSCLSCPAGTFTSLLGNSVCTQCGAGAFTTIVGSTSCQACPAGKYKFNSVTCENCLTGTYSPSAGASRCLFTPPQFYQPNYGATAMGYPCPTGEYTMTGGGAGFCGKCDYGFTLITAKTVTCGNCEAGKYLPFKGATVCFDCSAGTYSVSGLAPVCVECVAGKYTATSRSADCSPCDGGKYTDKSSSTACSMCAPNTYTKPDPGEYTSCTTCSQWKIYLS